MTSQPSIEWQPMLKGALASVMIGASTFLLTRALYMDNSKSTKTQEQPEQTAPTTPLKKQFTEAEFQELYERCAQEAKQRESAFSSKLYFNADDEFVAEDELDEIQRLREFQKNLESEATETELETKMKKAEDQMRHKIFLKYTSITVDYASLLTKQEGTLQVTDDMMKGADKEDRALMFAENLKKIRQAKPTVAKHVQPGVGGAADLKQSFCPDFRPRLGPFYTDLGSSQTAAIFAANKVADEGNEQFQEDSEPSTTNEQKRTNNQAKQQDETKEAEGLDLDPKKFEKERDQLFVDFFSMYTKQMAKASKKKQKQTGMKYATALK